MSQPVSQTQIYLQPRAAIRRLTDAGVVTGLDDANLDRLRAECWDGDEEQMEDVGVLGVLTSHYAGLERGMVDGFLWHAEPYWQEADDVVAELAAILKTERPLFRQLSAKVEEVDGTVCHHIEMIRDDGAQKRVDADSLKDVVALFNEELRARASERRIAHLETGDGWEMVVAIDRQLARRLATEGALPLSDPSELE